MAVPKKRTSKTKRNQRRAHDALKKINISFDKKTGDPKLPHHVTKNGHYNEKVIFELKSKKPNQDEAA